MHLCYKKHKRNYTSITPWCEVECTKQITRVFVRKVLKLQGVPFHHQEVCGTTGSGRKFYHSYCFIQLDGRALLAWAVAPAGGAAAMAACAGRAGVAVAFNCSGLSSEGERPLRS